MSAILVVGPAWVGDMVMAQSLFMALKARWPDRPIDVVAPPATTPLLSFMPQVRRGIPLALGHGALGLRARLRLGRSLRGEGYGTAIVLPRSFKSALVPMAARIPERIGYWGEARLGVLNRLRRLDKAALPRTVDQFTSLAQEPGQDAPAIHSPALSVANGAARAAMDVLGVDETARPVLALCPGAEYGPSKRWPSRHGAALARYAVDAGWAVWLLGGPGDRPVADEIARQAPVTNLVGRTSLAQAVALISRADRVVTNDSGLMHVAAALDRPLVALFGSSSPDRTPPLSSRATVMMLGIACQPCFKRECPLGHHDCLEKIEAASVFAALKATRAS